MERVRVGDACVWQRVQRCHPAGRQLADRHYSRQSPGAREYTPPGRTLVLLSADGAAVWASSWPYAEYVHRAFADAWLCSLFRNESSWLSSDLIRQAVATTRALWGEVPESGMVTMVDETKVKHKRDPGRCFRKAGFKPVGYTQERHLLILRLVPEDMPEAMMPDRAQLRLFEEESA